jgi:3-hydroxyacyl-CoA dehydrogenase/enoyl-CoA hydratase/carnithine racemase
MSGSTAHAEKVEAPAPVPLVALEEGEKGVAVVRFALAPGEKVVKIGPAFADALERVLVLLESQRDRPGIVFTGPSPEMFVAGADLEVLREVSDPESARALARRGQKAIQRIACLSPRTVAAISGPCLGGGLELALACGFRIASDHEKTRIGLPEVRLGIVPGFGGTQRLPRLLGFARALKVVLSGTRYPPRAALRLGLVDRVVPSERLLEFATRIALGALEVRRRPAPLEARLGSVAAPLRSLLAALAVARVRRTTGERFPAPFRAIELLRRAPSLAIERGLELEAEAIGDLATGPVSKNLVRLFFLGEAVRRFARPPGGGSPPELRRAAVVGCGAMGAGIAARLAEAGLVVRLQDTDAAAIERGLGRARREIEGEVRRGRLAPHEARARLDRLQPSLDGSGLERSDLVVEAIVESLDAKRALFARVAQVVRPDAILATNTSSLPVAEIARDLPRPERFVGMHFFNPVEKMPLVEVVRGPRTSPATVAAVASLAFALSKTPVVVGDGPGFLVNRIFAPYFQEAAALLQEGMGVEEVDRGARRFGMPMGPFAVLDEVGIDVAHAVARLFAEAFPSRFDPPRLLEALVRAGRLGRKSGAGFYRYGRRGRRAADPELSKAIALPPRGEATPPSRTIDRLFLPVANEALRCIEERIVERSGDVDLASVLGFGFPPERGGILRWALEEGASATLERLSFLRARHGSRFDACPLLVSLATARATLS